MKQPHVDATLRSKSIKLAENQDSPMLWPIHEFQIFSDWFASVHVKNKIIINQVEWQLIRRR